MSVDSTNMVSASSATLVDPNILTKFVMMKIVKLISVRRDIHENVTSFMNLVDVSSVITVDTVMNLTNKLEP